MKTTASIEETVFSKTLSVSEKRGAARAWLKDWARGRLPGLRTAAFDASPYRDAVTVVVYSFVEDEADFAGMEFSVLRTWSVLGTLPTAIVTDRRTAATDAFAARHPGLVNVQIEPRLRPGDIATMSADCIVRLHTRFSTPYCLIVQDDGFPVNDRLGDFLGRYDYLGAPSVRDVPAQHLVDATRCACLNGGFSLRSRRICEDVASQWRFWSRFIAPGHRLYSEDAVYSHVCCRNPFFRLRNRFPSSRVARRFSLPDFDGAVDIRGRKDETFGVHGPTAIWQLFHESGATP
jgi:hypothetical protein